MCTFVWNMLNIHGKVLFPQFFLKKTFLPCGVFQKNEKKGGGVNFDLKHIQG